MGKVRYKSEIHRGEHVAIVDADVFRRVQAVLERNGRGRAERNKHGALLRGILRCAACDCGMTHTYTAKGRLRYRYYVCVQAQQRGRETCPAPSVPAGEIERFVVDQIKCVGRDPGLVAATLAATRREAEEGIERLGREKAALERQRRDDVAEERRLVIAVGANGDRLACLADVEERIRHTERRLTEINEEMVALRGGLVDEREVANALAEFDGVWAALAPREQARVLALLIERVEYDGQAGNVSITFRPSGIKTLAAELNGEEVQ